jgi:hypothetical protein
LANIDVPTARLSFGPIARGTQWRPVHSVERLDSSRLQPVGTAEWICKRPLLGKLGGDTHRPELAEAVSCPTELQAQGPLTPSPTLERLVRLFQMGREGTIAKLGHCRLSPRADRRSERLPLMM